MMIIHDTVTCLVHALVIFVNADLTTLQIPNKINSSGVQTTLSKNGLPTDIVQKIYHYRPRGRAGAREAPDRPETLEVVSQPRITPEGKAQTDSKAQHTRQYVSISRGLQRRHRGSDGVMKPLLTIAAALV